MRFRTRKAISRLFLTCIAFLIVLAQWSIVNAVDSSEASSKIAYAEDLVASGFVAVFDANQAGANVSTEVARLNVAGGLLSEATYAFSVGDFVNASLLADQCASLVYGIVGEAAVLKSGAESDRFIRLALSVEVASLGLGILFIAGLFIWRVLRGRYLRDVSSLKPEKVAS